MNVLHKGLLLQDWVFRLGVKDKLEGTLSKVWGIENMIFWDSKNNNEKKSSIDG